MSGDRQLAQQLLDAALRLSNARPERNVPSPSSVARCTRQNWFKAHDVPKTHEPDNGESVIAAETGRLSEQFLIQVVEEAGLGLAIFAQDDEEGRELVEEELATLSLKGGQVDNIVSMNVGDGPPALVEFKRKGVFDILNLWKSGLREAIPDEFTQVQALMRAKGLARCLYVASNWDRGSLTWRTNKYDERPLGLYAEWVAYSRPTALAVKVRAEMQTRFIEGETDPARVPRDHDPFAGKFPCSWCRWMPTCKEAG